MLRHPRNKDRLLRIIDQRLRALDAQDQVRAQQEAFEEQHKGERDAHQAELARCAADFEHWLGTWCWTYDPRLLGQKTGLEEKDRAGAYVRFRPWAAQAGFMRWLEDRFRASEQGVCEKARDQGATYLAMAFCLHRWLFVEGFKATLTSFEDAKVDNLDDPDSMFEKMRIMLRRLPEWMLPDGFSWNHHDLAMRLVNPANGAVITGVSGKNPGRAGRSSIVIVDEADFIVHPGLVEAAFSANTDCIIWMSTYNPAGGPGSWFVQKRNSESLRPDQVYVLDWRDDPRKDAAWAAAKKASLVDPLVWEFEYERNYQAATEGICIPAKWVAAAQRLREIEPRLRYGIRRIAGVDVGAGKAYSIYVDRSGPIVGTPERRSDPNTTGTAMWALGLARERRTDVLNYDALGPGIGVTSTFADVEASQGLNIMPVANSDSPTDSIWPDGRMASEIFVNLRAECWWLLRCTFERTYEHVLFLEKQEGGVEHKLDELIALPKRQEVAPLVSQLSQPKWHFYGRGKIIIESKDDMRKRGIPSPDYADALALTMLEPPDTEAHGIFKRSWFRLWPNSLKLPEFSHIVCSVRTAFDDERKPKDRRGLDPTTCGIYGVFNVPKAFPDEKTRKAMGIDGLKYAALLCDFWSEPMGFGDALERIREASRTKFGSPGRRPDVVLIEEGGADEISLRHALAEFKVPAWPFASEQSRTMRAHEAGLLVQQGAFFVPESGVAERKGRFRDWAEALVRQLCSFSGKGSLDLPGAVDQFTAAMMHLLLRETVKVAPRRAAYPDPDEKTEMDERKAVEQYEREKRGKYSPYGS